MTASIPSLLLFTFAFTVCAEDTADELIRKEVDKMFPSLVDIRRDIHSHPELSNEEARTAQLVVDKLKSLGLEDIRTGVAKHGVVAVLKGGKPGPCVAIRADMDALPIKELRSVPYRSQKPGVMHACGHDVHTTVALGVAQLLSQHRELVQGSVKFIFQPAEEAMPATFKGDWGAKLMLAEGALEKPKPAAIFALHCSTGNQRRTPVKEGESEYLEAGQIGWNAGPDSAQSDRFQVVIKGLMAHGSAPHRGVDAIAVAAQCITALQHIRSRQTNTMQPLVISVGMIQGGQRENIIADQVEFSGTVRTQDIAFRDQVVDLMQRTLKGTCDAHGASYEFHYKSGYPVVYNDPALVKEMLPSLARVVGEGALVEGSASLGGEDFAYFSQVVPGFYFRLGVANSKEKITAGVHTPLFDVDERCLAVGVRCMATMVCDYLRQHAGDVVPVQSQK
jgi:amidohydrolase